MREDNGSFHWSGQLGGLRCHLLGVALFAIEELSRVLEHSIFRGLAKLKETFIRFLNVVLVELQELLWRELPSRIHMTPDEFVLVEVKAIEHGKEVAQCLSASALGCYDHALSVQDSVVDNILLYRRQELEVVLSQRHHQVRVHLLLALHQRFIEALGALQVSIFLRVVSVFFKVFVRLQHLAFDVAALLIVEAPLAYSQHSWPNTVSPFKKYIHI